MTTLPAAQRRLRFDTERVEREDLVMFINACFVCTGQAEFYGTAGGQAVSIEFLHEYILGNYRRLYARTLAAGINHFNQGLILVNLLQQGAHGRGPAGRAEEGRLIAAALRELPPQRALKILRHLRDRRVNNRRARAVVRDYLAARPDPTFDAVKYRDHVRVLAAHAHLRLPGEMGAFLFTPRRRGAYVTPLFERWRQARYAQGAIFDLPFTVAEGIAAARGLSREETLRRAAPQMTAGEQLRLQRTAAREGVTLAFDIGRAPLTRLAVYLLSLSQEERRARREELDAALTRAATRALRRAPAPLGRVAAVLDRSHSSSGSTDKRRRPLAVALGVSALLRVAAREYRAFWTVPTPDEVLVTPRGQTDLAGPLLDALAWGAEVIVIVSDGFENDPPGTAGDLAHAFRARLDPARRTSIVHLNPVFDSERYAPRGLGPAVPTVGLRDAEDLPTVLGFARFAEGTAPLSELEHYLEGRVADMLGRGRQVHDPGRTPGTGC
ncbi:hypothetical protein [Chondromyces apiculatus]|uniref:Uncharacterized protein n=1 Tax=Chondromyces apiculatus DSM 436 TaxID=1192034 RepID=A0A017T3X8_9BACT|nr:hypothetical protein [Chondromyces apiculatus]EYF03525.1 Hypothetical protein CAP_5509 [Chondromyces apiculatus DSM 436]